MDLNILSLLVILAGIILAFVVSTILGLVVVAGGVAMRIPRMLGRA
jgi:hypothetical protein